MYTKSCTQNEILNLSLKVSFENNEKSQQRVFEGGREWSKGREWEGGGLKFKYTAIQYVEADCCWFKPEHLAGRALNNMPQ